LLQVSRSQTAGVESVDCDGDITAIVIIDAKTETNRG
jgi:hypothetical protein